MKNMVLIRKSGVSVSNKGILNFLPVEFKALA